MKDNYLKYVVLALVAVVAMQAYYLYDINRSAEKKPIFAEVDSLFMMPDVKSFDGFFDEKGDPFLEMERLRRQMENNFRNMDNFFQTTPSFKQFSSRLYRTPRFDMKEQNGKYVITMEVPGSNNREIDTKVENGHLFISANISEEKEDNSTTYYRHERRTSHYKRVIPLPNDTDEKSLQSDYKDGLLSITFDKKSSK